jgi:ribonuclease R
MKTEETNMSIKELIVRTLIDKKDKRLTKVMVQNEIKINKRDKHNFDIAMKELINEGVVIVTKKKKVTINNSLDLFIGKFVYNPKGYGFCILTEKAQTSETIKDLFIPPSFVKDALHGDRIVARINKSKLQDKKAEGEIISILRRDIEAVVGTYLDNGTFGFVIPDNPKISRDIYVAKDNNSGAESYQKVLVNITKYPEKDRNPEGKVVEILGFKEEQGVDLASILAEYEIRTEFPPKVLQQVDKIPDTVEESELKRRKDFTGLNIFTIDGEDSKDLDDAISIKKLKNGHWELGVHIADVTHYVREGTKLDNEALERGTSVYLINKVIPMLPKKLSNGLCSLNPDTVKLTLSVFMEINKNGNVVKHRLYESYIKSRAKLNYTEVSNFLDGTSNAFAEKYPGLVEDIKEMEVLQRILEKKRVDRGSIEFNFAEAKITLDEEDKPIEVKKHDRRIANEIIEEFMLVTNETVAQFFFEQHVPFVYRIHEKPREIKLEEFTNFINLYGYAVNTDAENLTSKELQDIIATAKGKPEEQAINLLLLQSMQQARYSPIPKGHFGLGCKLYSHFTSPIRRYPDLQIHRIMKEFLNGLMIDSRKLQLDKIVEMSSGIASKRERQAQKAEMDYDQLKMTEYMGKRIGEEYEGMITSLTMQGVYITLDNTIEGFMKIERLDDDEYELVRDEHIFIGKNTGRKIMLGNLLNVSVSKVHLETKEILFDFVGYVENEKE